jgi:hypothetical protein
VKLPADAEIIECRFRPGGQVRIAESLDRRRHAGVGIGSEARLEIKLGQIPDAALSSRHLALRTSTSLDTTASTTVGILPPKPGNRNS